MALAQPIDHYAFQLHRLDAGHVCRGLLRLDFNVLSPLAAPLRDFRPGTPPRTKNAATLQELAGSAEVAKALAILAEPELRTNIFFGGGNMGLTTMALCRNRRVDANAVVMATVTRADAYIVQLFDSLDDCVTWNTDTLASPVRDEPASMLPPVMPMPAFIAALHGLDTFRRLSYESMLAAKVPANTAIAEEAFTSSMAQSMQHGDVRWLLPCLLKLVPSLASELPAASAGGLDLLVATDVFKRGHRAGTNEPMLLFGDKGQLLAVDFYRTWWACVGIEVNGWDGAAVWRLRRAFLANTALANHFFDLRQTRDGESVVAYTPLTSSGFAATLTEILDTAVPLPKPKPVAPPAAPVRSVAPPAIPMVRCSKCGTALEADAAFCDSCGARAKVPEPPPLPPAPLSCTKCGGALRPNAKFCPVCGTPTAAAPATPPPLPVVPQGRTCPKCKGALGPKAKFCGTCGSPA